MNLKKIKIISVINIFLLSFLSHYMYELFPSFIVSIFFPINESIWEHMKILSSSIIMNSLIEYLLLRKYNFKYNNYIYQLFITSILSIVIYLIIYLPLYNIFGENLFISISLMLIVYIVISIISYKILIKKEYKYINKISIILLILIYIIFGYLTYKPIDNYIFIDTQDEY